jgi:hypothetical protein
MKISTSIILFEMNPSTPRMVHMPTNKNYDVILGESTWTNNARCNLQEAWSKVGLDLKINHGCRCKVESIFFVMRAKCCSLKEEYCSPQNAFLCSRSLSSISFKFIPLWAFYIELHVWCSYSWNIFLASFDELMYLTPTSTL